MRLFYYSSPRNSSETLSNVSPPPTPVAPPGVGCIPAVYVKEPGANQASIKTPDVSPPVDTPPQLYKTLAVDKNVARTETAESDGETNDRIGQIAQNNTKTKARHRWHTNPVFAEGTPRPHPLHGYSSSDCNKMDLRGLLLCP